ncbi:MAG: hypothetical protein IJT77_14995, partial [Clostridia bacterium]|nr:hypothetical protein [Clostridia bacterium]
MLSEEDKKLSNEQTYDSALSSMVTKLDGYVVPLINEAFGKAFTGKAKIVSRNNKHIIQRTDGALARRESDAVVELSEMLDQKISKTYLIECEAWYDKTIVLRIAEYDSSVAIETAQVTDKEVILIHPHSAVIFLHPNRNIPKKMKITHRSPDGEEMSYYVPTLKITDYPVETIFEKKLLILLPFYLFRFANELNELEENVEKRKDLEDALTDINRRLEAFKKQGSITEYQKRLTQELLLRVSERLMVGYENIKKEVNEIMSGALARTKADEILEQGM